MKKEIETDGTKSLNNIPIWIKEADDLMLRASCWNGRVRVECNLNSPYLMNFMLNLTKEEAKRFVEQINLSIKDIREK